MYVMACSATKSIKFYFSVFPLKMEQKKKIIQKKCEGLDR